MTDAQWEPVVATEQSWVSVLLWQESKALRVAWVKRELGGLLQDVGLSGAVPKRVRKIGSLASFHAGGGQEAEKWG